MAKNHLFSTLEYIIPLMPGYVYLVDEKNQYKACTRAQALLFGLGSPNDIVNQTNSTLPLLKGHHELINTLDALYHQIQLSKIPSQVEEPVINQEGKIQVVTYHKIPLFDNKGDWVGILSLIVDDLSNEGATRTHLPNDIALRHVLTHLPEHVYWKDKNGVYLGCNLLQANDLNLNRCEDIIGKTDYDLSPKDKADLFWKVDNQVLTQGKTIATEEEVIKNGESRIVLSNKKPLYNDLNQIIGLIGISFDISDRKKMEEELKLAKEAAEAANIAKTEFLANMSHDIRTPLSGVVGLSDLLEHTLIDEVQREQAHLLHDSGEELLRMLNGILDDVRTEHLSDGDIQKEAFDINECVQDLVRLELPTTTLKNLKLAVAIEPDVPQYIVSDRKKIHSILLNLLGNAIKFTQSGCITIEVKCLSVRT